MLKRFLSFSKCKLTNKIENVFFFFVKIFKVLAFSIYVLLFSMLNGNVKVALFIKE